MFYPLKKPLSFVTLIDAWDTCDITNNNDFADINLSHFAKSGVKTSLKGYRDHIKSRVLNFLKHIKAE